MKNVFTLSAWTMSKNRLLGRVLALMMSLAFLFPTVGWAFQVQVYAGQPDIQSGPSSETRKWLREFYIPPHLGKVVDAGKGAKDMTLILIQDLHCNFEVQSAVRDLLATLTQKQPDLKLIAVEGATGILPAFELAALPDTPAKRATAIYFARQGKLTGADWFAVSRQAKFELFGAEQPELYSRSLDLIKSFATEENRGLLLELADLLKLVRFGHYNSELLNFELQREALLEERSDLAACHQMLVQEARRLRIPSFTPSILKSFLKGDADMQDLALQDLYLEEKIRERLVRTRTEQQLLAYQKYLETAGHVMAIAASPEEVKEFVRMRGGFGLPAIYQNLQLAAKAANLRTTAYANPGKELARLDAMLEKGLQFYALAAKRDRALYEQAVARARMRGDRKIVLITGGFHTPGIAGLAAQNGYSYINIRPCQGKQDVPNNYYRLLRYPELPTDLERMLSQVLAVPGLAMAPANQIATPGFRAAFKNAVQIARATLAARQGRAVSMSGLKFNYNSGTGIVKIISTKTEPLYAALSDTAGLILGRTPQDVAAEIAPGTETGLSARAVLGFLRSPVIRASGLILVASTALLFLPQILAGTAAAAAVWPVLLAGSLLLAAHSIGYVPDLRHLVNRRNIILTGVILGVLLLPGVGMAAGASLAANATASAGALGTAHTAAMPVFLDQGRMLISVLASLFSTVLGGLTVYPHGSASLLVGLQAYTGALGTFMPNLLFVPVIAVMNWSLKSSEMVHGRRFSELLGISAARRWSQTERRNYGQMYPEGQNRVGEILPDQKISELIQTLVDNGLDVFANRTAVDPYQAAVPEDKDLVSTPISSGWVANYIGDNYLQMFFRLVVIDPRRADPSGNLVPFAELPARYIRAVLNTLNPYVLSLIFKIKESDFQQLLNRAGNYRNFFEPLLTQNAARWQQVQASLPQDRQTLVRWLEHGFYHEITHGLILHMPDRIESVSPDLSPEEKERRQNISLDRYVDLLFKDKSLLSSVVFYKNLIKALLSIRKNVANANDPTDIVLVAAIETFCDRFGIFLQRNAKLVSVYNTYLPELFKDNTKTPVHEVYRLEQLRRTGQLAAQYPNLDLTRLEADLAAAETANVCISVFKDPVLTSWELEFFENYHRFLLALQAENHLGLFRTQHYDNSRVMLASRPGGLIEDAAVGFLTRQLAQFFLGLGNFSTQVLSQLRGIPQSVPVSIDSEKTVRSLPSDAAMPQTGMSADLGDFDLGLAGASEIKLGPTVTTSATESPALAASGHVGLRTTGSTDIIKDEATGQPAGESAGMVLQDLDFSLSGSDGIKLGNTNKAEEPDILAGLVTTGHVGFATMDTSAAPAESGPSAEMTVIASETLAPVRAEQVMPAVMDYYNSINQITPQPAVPGGPWPPKVPNPVPITLVMSPVLATAFAALLNNLAAQNPNTGWVSLKEAISIVSPSQAVQQGVQGNVMAVLTPESPKPTTVFTAYGNGQVATPADIRLIANPSSLSADVAGLLQGIDQQIRAALPAGVRLPEGMLAFSPALVGSGSKELVGGLGTPAKVSLDVNLAKQLLEGAAALEFDKTLARLKEMQGSPAWNELVSRGPVNFGLEAAEDVQMQSLLQQVNGPVIMFGDANQGARAAGYGLSGVALGLVGKGRQVAHLGPASALANAVAPLTSQNIARQIQQAAASAAETLDQQMRAKSVAQTPLARFLTQSELNTKARQEAFAENLKEVDRVLVMDSVRSGQRWVDARTAKATLEAALRSQGTRLVGQNPEPWATKLDAGEFRSEAKGLVKALSLAMATWNLVRHWKAINQSNPLFKGKTGSSRLPIFRTLTHPALWTSLLKILQITAGRFSTTTIVDPVLREELGALKLLQTKKLTADQIPYSLKYSLALLEKLGAIMQAAPVVGGMIKSKQINLDSLQAELISLIHEFMRIDSLSWYASKRAHLLHQIAVQETMDPVLSSNLMMDPQEAGRDLEAANGELARALQQIGQPGTEAIRTRIKHLKFALAFQNALNRMQSSNQPRNLRRLMSLLTTELSRPDVSEGYKNGILQVLTFIDPANQVPVQARLADGKIIHLSLPRILLEQAPFILENLLFHFDLYYQNGEPITAPEQHRVTSARQSA